MDTNSILMMLQDKLPKDPMSTMNLRDRLDKMSDEQKGKFNSSLAMIKLKSHVVGLVLGLFLGVVGADRFYKGDIGMGIAKLVLYILGYVLLIFGASSYSTALMVIGGIMIFAAGVWVLVDWFLVWKGIKKDNLNKIMTALNSF